MSKELGPSLQEILKRILAWMDRVDAFLERESFKKELDKGRGSITPKQKKYIESLCKEKKRSLPEELNYLSKEEASRIIDELIRQ